MEGVSKGTATAGVQARNEEGLDQAAVTKGRKAAGLNMSARKCPWQLSDFVFLWKRAMLLTDVANMSLCKSQELCAANRIHSVTKKDEICREMDGTGKHYSR